MIKKILTIFAFMALIVLGVSRNTLWAEEDLTHVWEPENLNNYYVVQPGDKLGIEVYREKDMSGTFTVNAVGNINYPILGEIHVEGLALDEMKAFLTDALSDYLVSPQVQIDFQESPSKSVSILGNVARPGNYILTPNMSLVRLISHVGGFTDNAAEDKVKILRVAEEGMKKSIEVNVAEIALGRTPDFKLFPGDMIFVEKTALETKLEVLKQTVYLFGQVGKPGNYQIGPGATLIGLISEAGGFTPLAVQSKVKIVRRSQNVKEKSFRVNAAKILDGSAEDVPIQAGDLIVVPESFF